MRSITCAFSVLLCSELLYVATAVATDHNGDAARRLVRDVRADGSIKPVRMTDINEDADLVAMSVSSDAETTVADEAAESEGNGNGAAQHLMSSRVKSILTEVEDMVRHATPVSKDKLKVIKDIVEGELTPDLKATRNAAQTQVYANGNATIACNTNMANKVESLSKTTKITVQGARANHSACREAEKTKKATMTKACKDLDDWLSVIVPPASLPNPKSRDPMVGYVKTMSTYFCGKGDEVTALDDKCTASESAHGTHKASCDSKQYQFELAFCTWRTELKDACGTQSSCYETTTKTFNDYKLATQTLVRKWKIEYAALQKILCFIQVWLSDNDHSTVDHTQFSHCTTHTVDTSSMNVIFPAVPAKAACSLAAVEKHPGTPGFVTAEYANFSAYVKPTEACLGSK